jgi:hypothetical protein
METSYYEQNGKSSSFLRTTDDAALGLDRALRNKLINRILMGAGKAPAFPDQLKQIIISVCKAMKANAVACSGLFVAFFICFVGHAILNCS